MGSTRYDAIGDYLEEVNKDCDEELFLSDVLYKEKEYKKYNKFIVSGVEGYLHKSLKPVVGSKRL